MINKKKLLLITALITSLLGCTATTVDSTGPVTQSDVVNDGFRYYLSKDLIKVSVTKTTTINRKVGDDLVVSSPSSSTKLTKPLITTVNVRDNSAYYSLDLSLNWLMDSNLKIEMSDTGILKSVNGDSKGKAGEVIKNSFEVVASVTAAAGGLGAPLTQAKKDKINNSSHIATSDFYKSKKAELFASLADLSNAELLMVVESKSAYLLWESLEYSRDSIQEAKNRIRTKEHELLKLNDIDKISKKQEQIELYYLALGRLSTEKGKLDSQWGSMISAFKTKKGLNAKTNSETFEQLFEISEFIPVGTLEAGLSLAQIPTKYDKAQYKKMDSFFALTGVILTAESPTNVLDYSKINTEIIKNYEDDALIFYRQKEPMFINAYAIDKDKSKLIYSASHNVIKSGPATSFVVFEENMFANHQMTLTFDEGGSGVLTILDRKTTSAAEGLTGALSTGIESATQRLTDISTSMLTYQENQRKLAKHDLQLQIDKATNKKALLDAQIALDKGMASEESLIEKARIDSELAALQSKYALNTQEKTFEFDLENAKLQSELNALSAKLALAKGQEGYDANLQTHLVTIQNALQQLMLTKSTHEQTSPTLLEIEKLTQEVKLLQLKQQLEELKKSKEGSEGS